jgi:hypothetical protein
MDLSDVQDGEVVPRFPHDCSCCTFVGMYDEYHLWFCTRDMTPIARYGSGGDYLSGLCFVSTTPALRTVARRAIEMGLLPPDTQCEGAGQGTVEQELQLAEAGQTFARDLENVAQLLEELTKRTDLPRDALVYAIQAATQLRILVGRERAGREATS